MKKIAYKAVPLKDWQKGQKAMKSRKVREKKAKPKNFFLNEQHEQREQATMLISVDKFNAMKAALFVDPRFFMVTADAREEAKAISDCDGGTISPRWPIRPPEEIAEEVVSGWSAGLPVEKRISLLQQRDLVSRVAATISGAVDSATGKSEVYSALRARSGGK